MQAITQRGIRREELLVRDVMTPQERLQVIYLEELRVAKVGHIVATLKAAGRQHALAVEVDANGQQRVRGMFSATDLPIGKTRDNLKAAIAGETHEYTDMYPGMAKSARDEGFTEIADWFETLAKAERHPRVYAIADEDMERETADKTSAVHFLRFELDPEMVRSVKRGARLSAGVDHPQYNVTVEDLEPAVRASLAEDLA